MVNVILNIILFAGKFIVGKLSGSVSITADAFNNLTDVGTVLLTSLGIKIASLGPGKRHPYGHGKFEWITSLVTSLSVFLVGWELLRNSVNAIKNPSDMVFSWITLAVLVASVVTKMFLYIYNIKKSKKNGFISLKAVAIDSLSDAISTFAVLVSLLLNTLFGLQLDGFFGIAVAIVIIFNSIKSFSDSVTKLMGNSASEEDLTDLKDTVKELCPDVKGVYNAEIEDFGYGHKRGCIRVTHKRNVSCESFISEISGLSLVIQQKLGYPCLIEAEELIDEEVEKRIINNVKEIFKEKEFDAVLDEIRVIKSENLSNQLRMTVYTHWNNNDQLKKISEFTCDPVNCGLSATDSVICNLKSISYDEHRRFGYRKYFGKKKMFLV